MDLVAVRGGWGSSGEGCSCSPESPHLLKVPRACLSTVRSITAMSSHFRRHATGRSTCALHGREHRPARLFEQKDRFHRFLLLSLLGRGGGRPISSASRLLQQAHALSGAPASSAYDRSFRERIGKVMPSGEISNLHQTKRVYAQDQDLNLNIYSPLRAWSHNSSTIGVNASHEKAHEYALL